MVASANWVPSSLGGRRLMPPCCGDQHQDEEKPLLPMNAPNQQHHQHHQAVPPFAGDLLHIDADDSDEEMEPFDAERFVDRLVEDDPSPWRCDGGGQRQAPNLWEAPVADPGTGMMTGHSSRSTAAAAKLFLQPISSWPLAPQPQQQSLPQQTLLDVAPAHSVFEEESRGMPIVVPHDPILDALFTPARATSPEIVPTVTNYGLVGVAAAAQQQQQLGGGSSIISRNDAVVTRFYPPAVYNIPTPVDYFPSAVRVPTAPLPLKHDDGVSVGSGFCLLGSPSRAKIIFGSEEEQGLPPFQQQQQQEEQQQQQQQLIQQQQQYQQEEQQQQQQQLLQQQQQYQRPISLAAVCQQEIPSKLFGAASVTTTTTTAASSVTISSAPCTIAAATKAAATSAAAAAATAPAPPQLTGADGFSDEYDDEQHAFLRRQEVALFVGPGYLAGPGRPGLVTPAERTSVVAWLCEVHAAAPAASFDGVVGVCGGVGGVAGGGSGGSGSALLSLESLFLAVNLLDRFLSTAEGARTSFAGASAMRVAAAASLALASKYEDTQAASLWGVAAASALTNSASCYCFSGGGESGDCCCSCGGGGGGGGGGGIGGGSSVAGGGGDVRAARKELAAMELRVASALGFRLTVPTALSFLGMFMRRADALGYLARGAGSERVREEAQQILLCVLRDACSLEHPPSALAASALYWASCVTAPGAAAPASFSFFAVTGYQLERLCRCLRDMESVRTGGGRRHRLSVGGGGDSGGVGGDWAGAAFPEHAERSLFDAGGGHPAIASLSFGGR